ncbi:MAG: DNA-directed RNA polymerase subunit omega [Candidatus Omnitrophota bacterium]
MEEISREKLIGKIGSIYKLCNIAALRAIELNAGFKKLVEADPREKVTTTAIREINQDKVRLKVD